MSPKTIGEHLKNRRLELGWGQQQVAEVTGYTWLRVSNWERGVYRPTKQAMFPIVAFLSYDPRDKNRDINTCPMRCSSAMYAVKTGPED